MLRGRSDIKKACLTCLIRLLFLPPLPPFSSTCPFAKLFLTAPICSTLLFSATWPLASLAVRNTGGDVCSPGTGVPHLETAGAAQPLPSEPQSWSCCTFGGSPQVSIWSGDHYIILSLFYPSILPSVHPFCSGLGYPGHFLSFASRTSFISRLPFLAHDCWKHYSIPIKAGSFTNNKLCLETKETEA